jgi:hypothetical protein
MSPVVDYTPYAVALLVGIVVLSLALLLWPLLKRAGGNVYMTWEEIREWTAPVEREPELLDWSRVDWDDLRRAGREP